jgi:hypothetical protein
LGLGESHGCAAIHLRTPTRHNITDCNCRDAKRQRVMRWPGQWIVSRCVPPPRGE